MRAGSNAAAAITAKRRRERMTFSPPWSNDRPVGQAALSRSVPAGQRNGPAERWQAPERGARGSERRLQLEEPLVVVEHDLIGLGIELDALDAFGADPTEARHEPEVGARFLVARLAREERDALVREADPVIERARAQRPPGCEVACQLELADAVESLESTGAD